MALCSKIWIRENAFSASRYLRRSAFAHDPLSILAYFAAVKPEGPAPMIATDLTFDRDMVTPRIDFTNYSN